MIKQFSILVVLILLSAFNAFANDDAHKEKVVTSKWSLVFGSAEVSNHFMSDQEYSGPTLGLSMDFGSEIGDYENTRKDGIVEKAIEELLKKV